MRKRLLFFYAVSIGLLVSVNLYSLAQIKKTYSKIDFFKDQVSLTPGYKSLSRKNATGYSSIPKLSYDKKGSGVCEIICLPMNLSSWQGRILKVRDSIKTLRKPHEDSKILNAMIMKIASDSITQKRHTIYAFYTPEQDVILESDLQNKVRKPRFPSFIYVFKREGRNWVLLNKVHVKDWRSFQDLEFNTVVSKSIQ